MKTGTILKISLLLLTASAPAIPGDGDQDLSQAGMNVKSYNDFLQSDQKLNAVYKKVMAQEMDGKARDKLRKAEKLWVQFRDAECDSQADENRGGSIVPLVYNSCAKELTDERICELKARLVEGG
jgi:uncharacterized protein YecT (DUF1311 family)